MRRTRDEFVELHFHELAGYILDAVTKRRDGHEMSLWLTAINAKLRTRLERAYDDLKPEEKPGVVKNGRPEQPAKQ